MISSLKREREKGGERRGREGEILNTAGMYINYYPYTHPVYYVIKVPPAISK